jgi:hypothetical protein
LVKANTAMFSLSSRCALTLCVGPKDYRCHHVIEGELLVPSETGDVTLASQDDKSKTHYSEENAVYNTK